MLSQTMPYPIWSFTYFSTELSNFTTASLEGCHTSNMMHFPHDHRVALLSEVNDVLLNIGCILSAELRNTIYQYAIDIDDKKWFLGMPKSKKWLLYGQDLDPFALHEYLGFDFAQKTGEYAIRTQYCEVTSSGVWSSQVTDWCVSLEHFHTLLS